MTSFSCMWHILVVFNTTKTSLLVDLLHMILIWEGSLLCPEKAAIHKHIFWYLKWLYCWKSEKIKRRAFFFQRNSIPTGVTHCKNSEVQIAVFSKWNMLRECKLVQRFTFCSSLACVAGVEHTLSRAPKFPLPLPLSTPATQASSSST